LVHLLALQITLECIEEQSIVGNAVPVKHLLFLLRANAVVFVQEVQERALGLLEGCIGAGFEISQVGEDTLFKFL
jgi:hypothetical protein